MNGGTVSTDMLSRLYSDSPWLMGTVGGLMEFCAKSATLQYTPRTASCRPKVSIPLSLATAVGGNVGVQVENATDEERYVPHWKSRVNLKAQLRQGSRPLPRGFNPRARAERRARARAWCNSFLQCFCPDISEHVDGLIKATRRWPECDENAFGTASRTEPRGGCLRR